MPLRVLLLLLVGSAAPAAVVSPLFERGYRVLPLPQRVDLHPADFPLSAAWSIAATATVPAGDIALTTLHDELAARYGLRLREHAGGPPLTLDIRPGAVPIGPAASRDRAALARQAYRLELASDRITLTANAAPGLLLYGVYTLVQLVQPRAGALWLPEAVITDWPDLELRHLYWDDAHHLETLSEFQRIIRQAAFFKANGLVLKLEGHFQYRSAPALVEPYALSPAELQELTTYALRYHVQLIPYLDAPGHLAFLLKHPEYASLRAFPDNNYEMCVANPASARLLQGMFQDLLDANRGGQYFYLSTDEPYYLGLANSPQCPEQQRLPQRGTPGKLLAEFLRQTAVFLQKQGRTVMFWGESPLTPADVPALPPGLVNGEVNGPEFDRAFRAHGIRQMIYTSSAGEEKLFPAYFLAPLPEPATSDSPAPRVADNDKQISFGSARRDADLLGAVNAGWADMGLHPETFWLGYAAATAAAWHPATQSPAEATAAFYRQFYAADLPGLDRIYQLMSMQAQFWSASWDTAASSARPPIWGNSRGPFQPRRPAHDQTLPLPSTDLTQPSRWPEENAARLRNVSPALAANDELLGLLHQDLPLALRNRYNLKVLLALAQLCRQNLNLLTTLSRLDADLTAARSAKAKDPAAVVAALDRALDLALGLRDERNQVYQDAVAVWYESWQPRVSQANGRRFLHQVDDVKDHLPDRTVDMSYLIYRELLLPLGDWFQRVIAARNEGAAQAGQPARSLPFDWSSTAVPSPSQP